MSPRVGTEPRVNALTLVIPAPAVLRCAFVYDVIVYTVVKLTIWYCRITYKMRCALAEGAPIMEQAICTGITTSLDSLNT